MTSSPCARRAVADTGNHAVRVVTAWGAATLAGTGTAGFYDSIPTEALGPSLFSSPRGLLLGAAVTAAAPVSAAGSLTGRLLVADAGNRRLRSVDLTTGGTETLFFGDGASTEASDGVGGVSWGAPTGLAAGPEGQIFVVDAGGNGLWAVRGPWQAPTAAGASAAINVAALAGDLGGASGWADGTGSDARLSAPWAAAVLPAPAAADSFFSLSAASGVGANASYVLVFVEAGSHTLRALTPLPQVLVEVRRRRLSSFNELNEYMQSWNLSCTCLGRATPCGR